MAIKLIAWVLFYWLFKNCIGQNVQASIDTRMLNVTEGIFSQLIVRHGDRTPKITWPTDLHSKSSWPTGFGGKITLNGKQQCFKLGKWIRRRYASIQLLNGYHSRKIYIRSTDLDRCIQCVLTVAASMFPPDPQEILSAEIPNWQPVSVHTIPAEYDYWTGNDHIDCPLYDKEYAETMELPIFAKYQEEADAVGFYANMSKFTGLDVKVASDAIKIKAELEAHRNDNRTLPDWADYILKNELFKEIRYLMMEANTYTETMAKIRSGFFLKEMLDRAKTAKDPTVNVNSMYMYSVHGKTIANLLHALKMLPDKKPVSASVLIFESFDFDSVTYLRILLRNPLGLDANATTLLIPGCGWQCPIDRMYEIFRNVLPSKTFEDECVVE